MTATRSNSFCWAFCLSFACILVWFVPIEALFAAPMPRATDGGDDEDWSLVDAYVPQVPKKLRMEYRTVFGESFLSGPWAKKSALAWDGLSPHPLLSLDGPCIYLPTTEVDITADVELDQPMLGVRFISTTGWLTGPNGSFPIGFLAASYEEETLLFFTGLLPGELFFDTDVEIEPDTDIGILRDLTPCPRGLAQLEDCNAQLDSILLTEASQSSQTMRHMMGGIKSDTEACQFAYQNTMSAAAAVRTAALNAAAAARTAAKDAAKQAAIICIAAAHAILVTCLAAAAAGSFFTLGLIAPLAAAACSAAFLATEAACLATLVVDTRAADNAFAIAVAAANAAYVATRTAAQNALRFCLSQLQNQRVAMACIHIPQLGQASIAALESHRACYGESASFNQGCFESTGLDGQLEHAFHQALDGCGTPGD